jgi:hypothetical protein
MLYVGSIIGIMTWLLDGRSEVHLLADGKKLLPSPKSPEWLWNTKKSPTERVTATLSSGRKPNHSPLFHSEIQNEWSYI